MLKTFFQPGVDEEGKFNLDKPNEYYSLFAGENIQTRKKVKQLDKLKIVTYNGDQYLTKEGQHPVIL